jgi:ADP-ribosylation factor related protein 1
LDVRGQSLVLWDLGGQRGLQSIWDKYYVESHAVIYVVDAADRSRFEDSKAAFESVRSSPHLQGAPLLLMANKQDLEGTVGLSEIADFFGVGRAAEGPPVKVVPVCAYTGMGLRESMEWLVNAIRVSPRARSLRVHTS